MQRLHRHFPPLTHTWACSSSAARDILQRYTQRDAPPAHPTGNTLRNAQLVNQLSGVSRTGHSRSGSGSNDMYIPPAVLLAPHVHRQSLLHRTTVDILAKRPINPVLTLEDLRREVISRLVVNALQQRWGQYDIYLRVCIYVKTYNQPN